MSGGDDEKDATDEREGEGGGAGDFRDLGTDSATASPLTRQGEAGAHLPVGGAAVSAGSSTITPVTSPADLSLTTGSFGTMVRAAGVRIIEPA
eukprot:gene2090-52016_t